jgi:hypothetical protein
MSIYFVFVDGLGLTDKNEYNPLFGSKLPFFNEIVSEKGFSLSSANKRRSNHIFIPIDANLGVEGLPQSGTGQVSLFTGINAADHIGKHFGPYPHSQTHSILKEWSLIKRLHHVNRSFRFMNAYPPIFFKISEERNRWSTTTLMCRQQSQSLFSVDDLHDGRGITAEITQDVWRDRLSIEIEPISIETAATRMIRTAQMNDVVMYEYYLTDKAGHEMDFSMAEQVVRRLDTFLGFLYKAISKEDLIIVTSDHGNIEDLSIKTHTRNPVPLIVLGKHAEKFSKAQSITDVIPTLVELSA